MSLRMTAPAALFLSTVLGAGHALAWGPEGHAIVAEIAEARLTDAARAQVAQLLTQENHQHLDEVASWADDYRVSHPETGGWHYVDIPLSTAAYDANRDCAGGNCVVVQIQSFAATLGNKNAAPADRLVALKFVVHFVGDIHQPLHAEDDDDKGGNDVHITYFGKSTNLHSVWDGRIIEQARCDPGAELHAGLGSDPESGRCSRRQHLSQSSGEVGTDRADLPVGRRGGAMGERVARSRANSLPKPTPVAQTRRLGPEVSSRSLASCGGPVDPRRGPAGRGAERRIAMMQSELNA
jgi:hypothetical protein